MLDKSWQKVKKTVLLALNVSVWERVIQIELPPKAQLTRKRSGFRTVQILNCSIIKQFIFDSGERLVFNPPKGLKLSGNWTEG
jgi:hypothetical protein